MTKIRYTIWYLAIGRGQWLALLGFSAAAWNRAASDRWIGLDRCYQYPPGDCLGISGDAV